MATQVTQVYAKRESDTSWTKVEQLYDNQGRLLFQESPTQDEYYDYTNVVLTITAIQSNIYAVRNDSGCTVDVKFNNGVVITFNAGTQNVYPINVKPSSVQINGLGYTNVSTHGTQWKASVKSKYHPPVYTRELYL